MRKPWALALVLVLGVPGAAGADSREKSTARTLLAQGSAKYQRGDFAGAVSDFQKAYATYPSPKILFNLGQAYRALHQPDLAAESFGRFLADASQDVQLDERKLKQARSALKELAPEVVRVQVEVSPPNAALRLDGERDVRGDFYLRRDSDPARPHHLVASAPDRQPRNRDFTLAEVVALQQEQRKLLIEPLLPVAAGKPAAEPPAPVIIAVPPTSPRPEPTPAKPTLESAQASQPAPLDIERHEAPRHTGAYVAAGVGGGLLVVGGVLGAIALGKKGSLSCGASTAPCTAPADVDAARSAHQTAIAADIFFGAAVAAGATATVLWFAAPTPGGSGGEVGVAGRF